MAYVACLQSGFWSTTRNLGYNAKKALPEQPYDGRTSCVRCFDNVVHLDMISLLALAA
ncbi:hypothetical protein ACFOEK_12870 [Litoribrevibacter euphylliae]|uniref:Uncharacterized protein n=1 Tax=Litoribrevibacter euphylliae TaxID=1834034 RepID=A0ABV7HH35_9GAMM